MCVFMPGFDPFASICHMVSIYCLTLHLKSVTVCNHTLFVDGGHSTLTEASSYREVQWQRLSVFVLAGAPGVQHDLRLHCQCTRPHRGKHLSCSWQTQERTPALTVKVCKFCGPCIWDLSTGISTCPSLLTGCSMLFHSGMFVILDYTLTCSIVFSACGCRIRDSRNQKLLERSEDSWNCSTTNFSLQGCWSPVQCSWR